MHRSEVWKWWTNQLRVQGVAEFALDGSGKLERTQNLKALECPYLTMSLYSEVLTSGALLTLRETTPHRLTNS